MVLPNRFFTAAFFVLPIIGGVLAARWGQAQNWDLRNYHYYNAYAWWNKPPDFDLLVADANSYLNPLLDLFYYSLERSLRPRPMFFVIGFVQSLNFVLVYRIARRLLNETRYPRIYSAGAAVMAMSGSAARAEFGGFAGDNLLSLFLLGAILVDGKPAWRTALAGALTGFGATVKLVMMPFAVGAALATLFTRRRRVFAQLAGQAVGAVLGAGYWSGQSWRRYANPVFPFYNDIFKSPLIAPERFSVLGKLPPQTLVDYLRVPFDFFRFSNVHSDIYFRDARIPLALCALVVYWTVPAGRRRPNARLRYLAIMFPVAFATWAYAFGAYRYLLPLELLTPAVLAAVGAELAPRRWMLPFVGAALATVAFTRVEPSYRVPVGETLFEYDVPQIAAPERTTILLPQQLPAGYLVPAFPPSVRFIRVGTLYGFTSPLFHPGRLQSMVDQALALPGQTYLALFSYRLDPRSAKALGRAGFAADLSRCRPFRTSLEHGQLCAVIRLPEKIVEW